MQWRVGGWWEEAEVVTLRGGGGLMYRNLSRRGQERSAAFPLVLNVRPGGGRSLGRFTAVVDAPFWNRGKIHNQLYDYSQ